MSFKRDENDPGPLGALQRRRVAELLASAIPEDEALLLRDGRLACSLCPHRPVCDTLEMLVLHRAGRKHLDSLQRSYARLRSPQVTPQGPQVTPQEAPGEAPGVQAKGQQLPGWDPQDDPKEFPDAAGAVAEFWESRKPQRGRSQGKEIIGKEREFPDFRRVQREFPDFRGAEPGAAPDPAAPPAPAQPGLAPGSRRELGEGRERRVRLR